MAGRLIRSMGPMLDMYTQAPNARWNCVILAFVVDGYLPTRLTDSSRYGKISCVHLNNQPGQL